MNAPNRDLLVMFRQELMSPQDMEQQVSLLHSLLFQVERLDNVVKAHEIIDLNRFRIISKLPHVKSFFRSQKEKPFVFLNNLN